MAHFLHWTPSFYQLPIAKNKSDRRTIGTKRRFLFNVLQDQFSSLYNYNYKLLTKQAQNIGF